MVNSKISGVSNFPDPVVSDAMEGTATVQRIPSKIPEQGQVKTSSSEIETGIQTKTPASYARSLAEEIQMKGSYVEASLHQKVESYSATQKDGSTSALNGMRIGWLKNGSEVVITRSLSPAGGHETRMDAIAFARLTGADPTAVVRDREGKWHAVQTNRNFHEGFRASSDNPLREVEGLPHFDKKKITDIQQQILEARKKGDYQEVSRLQKHQAALIFGVPETEINFIRNSSDRIAGKININAGKPGGGMHGAEKSPNTNFDPTKKNAIEIGIDELENFANAPGIIFHENSHAKDYALTQHWISQYQKDTGKKFVPGDYGDMEFTKWINNQAPKRLSRADAELVSDVSANANGSSEAKAYVGTFINALKAGNFEAAAAQLKTYAAGMTSKPLKINRPTGAHVELELKRQLEIEYRKMPKEMQAQFDKIFKEIAKTHPDAWISKFNHATALKIPGTN